jgi:hypothetical protein
MLCRLGSGGVFSAPLRGMSNGIQEQSAETHLSGAGPDPWVRECEMAHLWSSFLNNLAGSTVDWRSFVGPKRCETLPGPRQAPSRLPQGRTAPSSWKANQQTLRKLQTSKRANDNCHIRPARIVPPARYRPLW